MSFIWTVGVEALVRPQLQPTPPPAPPPSPPSPSTIDKTPRRHTNTQHRRHCRQKRQSRRKRQKTEDDLCGDRETCLARVTAAACVAFHIICLSYGPLATLHIHRPLSSSLSLPFGALRTYLFMPHVKSEQRAKFSPVLLVIRSAKRRSCLTSLLLHLLHLFPRSNVRCVGSFWNFYTHS